MMLDSDKYKSESVEVTIAVIRDMLYKHLPKGFGSIKFEVYFHQGQISSVSCVEETKMKIGI